MSAIQIVGRLLHAAPNVTNQIEIGAMRQPMQPPFIVLSHVYEAQTILLQSAVEHYNTRVSVEIIAVDAIQCDRQAEAVKAALGYVIHETITDDESPPSGWEDVSIFKAGGDILDFNDERTAYRRVIDFNVHWKPLS